ncbi:MAG TPA: hypothetical protein VNA25_23025 [Phycisphaerae bacterium]|nr:hypothetical protein [Phycisphaerae bacterium]
MVSKLVELTGLAGFGTLFVLSEVISPELPVEVLKWGGLISLVSFMVVQNYRLDSRMAKAVERKDKEALEARARSDRIAADFSDAINNIASALKDRPCLVADSRVPDPKVKI